MITKELRTKVFMPSKWFVQALLIHAINWTNLFQRKKTWTVGKPKQGSADNKVDERNCRYSIGTKRPTCVLTKRPYGDFILKLSENGMDKFKNSVQKPAHDDGKYMAIKQK